MNFAQRRSFGAATMLAKPGRSECPVCHSKPMVLKNLYLHLRKVHFWEDESVQELKRFLKLSRVGERKVHECEECKKVYFSDNGLAHHMKKVHGVEENIRGRVTCPSCRKHFASHGRLALHCLKVHKDENPDQDYRIITGTMSDWTQFVKWKRSKEQADVIRLMRRSSCVSNERRITTYLCEYARGRGEQVDALPVHKRSRPSKRIHSHCSAFLKVTLHGDGSVEYWGTFGHIGHSTNNVTLPSLPIDEQSTAQISKAESPTSIMAECSSTKPTPQKEVLLSDITNNEHNNSQEEEVVLSDVEQNEYNYWQAEELLSDIKKDEYNDLQAEEVLFSNVTKNEYDNLQAVQTQFNEVACMCLRDGLSDALVELRTALEAGIERVTSATGRKCSAPARTPVVQKSDTTPHPQLLVPYESITELSTERKAPELRGRNEAIREQQVKAEIV
ncbi:hypothetical protein Aduo_016245 [Ancylostoma duodenale]